MEPTIEERIERWLDDCYHPNSTRSMLEKNSEAYRLLAEVLKERKEQKDGN